MFGSNREIKMFKIFKNKKRAHKHLTIYTEVPPELRKKMRKKKGSN